MKLSQLGEFGLISRIAKHEPKRPTTLVGIGDDCAVIELQTTNCKLQNKSQPAKTKCQLITTDTLVEDVHFRLKGTSFFKLGYKALAVNISDIAAMGGWPTHALVTLGLPKKLKVKAIDELYRGINQLARKLKIDIIGGDTVASPKALVISLTLLGEVEKENLLLRSTAKQGDLICVTGKFGGAAAKGYDSRTWNVERRTEAARTIAKSRLATAMIDSSDGLVRSILEICKASKVEARIDLNKVPIAKGATLEQALYGGEEYELVFTVPKSKARGFKVVGEIVGKGQGNIQQLKGRGFDHFK